MLGKREKRDGRLRLPAILVLIVTAALVVASGGHQTVAADSPVEAPVERRIQLEEATEAVRSVLSEEARNPEPETPETPVGPVPEGGPVEDTYFENPAFLGDSRTQGFQLYSGLKTGTYYTAVGATVESVFTKKVDTKAGKMPLLDAMAKQEFDKIYVMLGVNELGWSKTETFRDQYAKVIDRLHSDHPDAEIILQTILPVSAKQEKKKTYVNNGRIAAYNEVIFRLAEEKGCDLVDAAEAVTDENGCLRAEWNSDGVHLNVKGCRAWLEYLRTHPVGETEAPAETPAETVGTEPSEMP